MLSKDKAVSALRHANPDDLGTLLAFVEDNEDQLGRWTTIRDDDDSKTITLFLRQKWLNTKGALLRAKI